MFCKVKPFLVLILAGTALVWTACAETSSQEKGAAGSKIEKETRPTLAKESIGLKKRLRKKEALCSQLEKRLKEAGAAQKDQEEQIARLKLLLVEKEAQIKEKSQRLAGLQKRVDEAIREVVRAKAKLRSLESRAEAASNMAEAEIALKALKTQVQERKGDPELVKAEKLLKMSSREFKRENYGGALYLASQAKGHIGIAQARLGKRKRLEPVQGEMPFALPLPIQVIKTSNVREGPGLEFKVIATVESKTPLIGYSHKGQWVRVKGENGLNGWIFQTLVSGR